MVVITARPTTRPITGATTMKMRVLVQPDTMTAPNPALATAAPAYPPKSACDELVGNPKYHVIRFQMIAPVRPAKMTVNVTTFKSTMPEPTVLATPVPKKKAATKLKKAAHATACSGVRTRVDTTVAMEFAASWKPLMKSKTSAIRMMNRTSVSMRAGASGHLQDD